MDVVNKIGKIILPVIVIAIIIVNIPVSNQSSRFAGDADSFSITMENSSISFKSKSIELLANEIIFYRPKNILIEYNNGTAVRIDRPQIYIEYNKKVYQPMTDIEMSLFLNYVKIDKDYIDNDSIFSGVVNRNAGDYRQLTSMNQKVTINENSAIRASMGNENIADFKKITFKMDNTSFAHVFTDQINMKAYGISEFKISGQLSKITLRHGEGILGLNNHEFEIKSDDILDIEMMANYNSRLSADDGKITFHGITSSARLNNQNIIKNDIWYMLTFKPEKINAYATLLLAFITIIYVIFTGQMVEQTKKTMHQTDNTIEEMRTERKMTFIMKRLEEFYYPLCNLLKTYVWEVQSNANNKDNVMQRELSIRFKASRKDKNDVLDYTSVVNRQYLAESDTKAALDYFLKFIIVKDKVSSTKDLDCYDKFVVLIKRDINKLRDEFEILLDR